MSRELDFSDPCYLMNIFDCVEQRMAALEDTVEKFTSTNTQSSTCRCVLEKRPHFESKTGDKVTAVSLSLTVNKECPIHGHYFG
jgi:hypothetical protein